MPEGLDLVPFGDNVAARLPPAARPVDATQPVVQRAIDGFLEPGVEGGLDRQPVLIELLGAVTLLDLLADFFEEVRRDRLVPRCLAAQHDRLLFRGLRFVRRDVPDLRHPAERVITAPDGGVHVHVRALLDVALQNPGNQRSLFELEVLGGFAEVKPRRGFDAVHAVAEIHLVAVEREDLALGVPLLDAHRKDRLADLAFPRFFVGQEQLAGKLLGQGARTSGLAPLHDVLDERDGDPRNAEADVLLEIVIFSREDRLAELGRDGFVGNDFAPLDRELTDDLALRAVHTSDRARSIVVERGDLFPVIGKREENTACDPKHRGDHEQQCDPGATSDAYSDSSHKETMSYELLPATRALRTAPCEPRTAYPRPPGRLTAVPARRRVAPGRVRARRWRS